MSQIANNQMVWRVLLNGFPYKTPAEMGVPDERSAFAVTKQAVYAVLDGRDTSRYSGVDEIGNQMADAVRRLVDIGRNGTQTYQDPVINVSSISPAGVDSIDSNYISQTFNVSSEVNMKDINVILDTFSAPTGTKVTDINNNERTNFDKGENFKVLVPRENIKDEITVQFTLSGQCETYPILFGKAPNDNVQDYVLTTDPFVVSTAKSQMNYKPSVDIEIDKISSGESEITGKGEGEPLEGAKFNVKSEDGSFNKDYYTDANGKITLSNMDIQKYIITELESAKYYLLNKDTQVEVTPEHDGDDQKVVFENTPVDIKVNVDKDSDKEEVQGNEILTYTIDNIKNLSNVPLDNFTLTDDLPDEVRLQKLQTGTYNEDLKYSIYYNTNKRENIKLQDNLSTKVNNEIDFTNLELAKDEYVTQFQLKFGTVKIGFSNVEEMTVTTKAIEGLEKDSVFENNVNVEGTYIDVPTEDEDDVPTKVYENVLKVTKVSKEYNQYTELEKGSKINATFEILDENKNHVETVKTTDGEFTYKYLETGKQYFLKELSVDDYYVISEELIPFKFEENGQTIEITVENDNVNLVVDVEKNGPTQAKQGDIITYDFNHVGNFSNVPISDFIFGDKLPRQVRLQSLTTGTWNEELTYKIQYITNQNTNWAYIGEDYSTKENYTVDFTTLDLQDGEYVTQYRFIFGDVKEGFREEEKPTATVKINEDLANNKIIVNDCYVNGQYVDTPLEDEDDAHTIVYTPEENKEVELPKTGM